MSDRSDIISMICISILIGLCAGEPDLLDAIISYINRQ